MPSSESTMVPVAVYRGDPVKRRYLWSEGNIDTINNAIRVGKLETGENIERNLEQKEFILENLVSFLTSGNSQNLCLVLPIDYIDRIPVNDFVQCDFTSVLIDSEPGSWITSYAISVFGDVKNTQRYVMNICITYLFCR